jgi:hypothetical protein
MCLKSVEDKGRMNFLLINQGSSERVPFVESEEHSTYEFTSENVTNVY